jgi:S-(hydroxymethyl)glutathione dehydrogenase/alcohol dehydrogenase
MNSVDAKRIARAAVLVKVGQPLELMDLEIPALAPGQVLVKILYSGVCRSQLMEVRGNRGEDRWIPHLLGHEGSGIVVEVGGGVTKIKQGDEVILGWLKGRGLESLGVKYKSNDLIINSGAVATFANYAVVSENRVVKKPKTLSFDAAVLFGCALPTGVGMVLNELKPSKSSTVIILGLGGIGFSSLIAAIAIGVKKIIAVDISQEKLDMASKLGAHFTINTSDQNFRGKLNPIIGEGADYCIESCGRSSTIELGFSLIRPLGGRLLFASHPPEGDLITLRPHDLISGKQIAGSWGGSSRPDTDVPEIFALLSRNDIALDALFTKRYKLEQINQALMDLESGNAFRPLIVMHHPD